LQKFAETESTYGIVVTAATTTADIKAKRDVLTRMDPDNIVLLSVEPHNVQARIDWPEIGTAFEGITRTPLYVEHVAQEKIARLAQQISVLQ
jgi:hypothetical protein